MNGHSKIGTAVQIATNGVATLAPQVYAMMLLPSVEFGAFSAMYLSFALLIAFSLSICSDPWVVLGRRGHYQPDDHRLYTSIMCLLLTISIIPITIINGVLSGSALGAAVASAAVIFAAFRSAGRFFSVHTGNLKEVISSDLVFIAAFITGAIIAWGNASHTPGTVYLLWLVATIASTIFLPKPSFDFGSAAKWLQSASPTIRPLVRDTIIMEASYVGVPYALLPVLGLHNFGIYRAISNTSAPVRLGFAPLRPAVVASPRRLCAGRSMTFVTLAGALLGAAAAAALIVLPILGLDVGVFQELGVYAWAAALFVLGTTLITVYTVVTRAFGNTQILLGGRIAQTALGLALPLAGFVVGGGHLAIWGLSISTLLSGFCWTICGALSSRATPNQAHR